MDVYWVSFIPISLIPFRCAVIIARLILGLCGLGMFLIGFLTIVTPDINHIYVPFDVTSDPMAIFVRTYGGFFLAAGYLTLRFIYSSSKVQIGNILIYIVGCMMVARVFSFIYEGFYQNSVYTFLIMLLLFSCLYYLQRKRKNEISYDL